MASQGIYNRGKQLVGIFIKNELMLIFNEEAIPKIKGLIMEAYKSNLNGVVQGEYDSIKPENMESIFEEELASFGFIKDIGKGMELRCPSPENFNFGEKLSLIGAILNGIPSDYYKVPADKFAKLIPAGSQSSYDIKEHLIAGDNPFLENVDKTTLDKFEFSAAPPINIMENALDYVKGNMPIWVGRAVRKAEINYKEYMRGVNRA